jgi:glycosyltransferase involved in cell wall biosynthesis
MKATVITSSIGRPELKQCIESVRAQSVKVRHLVFVNGEKYHESARSILKDYPEVSAFYLPEETGDYGMGGSMADVFAAGPFLTRSDWILFLDDDNFFKPDHVETLLTFAEQNNLAWAYSLRCLVDKSGAYICDDDWCSLGRWPIEGTTEHLVDNSCYLIRRNLACRMALAWTAAPFIADRCFCLSLMESGEKYGCTGLSTINYRIGTGTAQDSREYYLTLAESIKLRYPNGFPWRKPSVF